MENEEINQKILNLWKDNLEEIKSFDNGKALWPVLFPDFRESEKSILFLGINPSGDSKEDFKIKNKAQLDDKEEIREFISGESKCIWENGYRIYFRPFQEIARELGLPHNHLDLYFLRKRSSKKFKKLLDTSDSDFFKKQLELSITTIQKINPKIIFIANKEASKIFEEIKKMVWNEEEGFYILNENNRKIPVFLSGMISSTRVIDNYSKKRLIWHLKRAKNWFEANNK